MSTSSTSPPLSMARVLWCGAAIVTISMGVRHGFGLWLQPVTMARGWSRETFAFAIATQNLVWGLAGPFAGMLADRLGAVKVLMGGALLYSIGLAGMAWAVSSSLFFASAGLLIGVAQSATTYAVIYGVIGRNVGAEKRSMAMGLAAAAGSFGQFMMIPVDSWLIASQGWDGALLWLALAALAIIPLSLGLREPGLTTTAQGQVHSPPPGARAALVEALKLRDFQLLMLGYFVCGFQVVFIGVHMPAYLKDHGFGPALGRDALALIGLFNVLGTYSAGWLGQYVPKRHILASIYLLRSVVIGVFLLLPLTPQSVYLFAATMGVLWLSTVPATNAIVAQIFGVRNLSMLAGTVFLSHQIGSFLGVWLGGKIYDAQGNYNLVWALAIALGLLAALVNLPIREGPLTREPALKAA